jgi:hypothetical protein
MIHPSSRAFLLAAVQAFLRNCEAVIRGKRLSFSLTMSSPHSAAASRFPPQKGSPEGVTADLTGEPRTALGGHRSALVLLAQIGAVFPFGLLLLAKNLSFVIRRQGNAAEAFWL